MSDENLDRLMKRDPLIEAEQATGKSYKEDQGTLLLGMLNSRELERQKREALSERRDTYYDLPFTEHLVIAKELGFEQIFTEQFRGRYGTETFAVLWRDDGVLMRADSFLWGDGKPARVNHADIYFNHRAHDEKWWCQGSGSYVEDPQGELVGVRHQDVREGLRRALGDLEEHGEFVSPWIKRPFLWLMNYTQKPEGKGYEAVNEAVIAQFPAHVHAAITPEH